MGYQERVGEEAVESGRNVLLTGEWLDTRTDRRCGALLGARSTADVRILLVSVTRSPLNQLLTVERWTDAEPVETVVVNVDPVERSGDEETGGALNVQRVERVNSPANLTGLGVAVTDWLSQTQSSTETPVMCLHSVTPLVLYNSLDDVFHFLRVITDRVEQADGLAHYHFDPSAHDRTATERLAPLFDRVTDATEEP